MRKGFFLLWMNIISLLSFAQVNSHDFTSSGAGDLTVSLGRYQIGTAIDILFRAEGNYSEIGSVYNISGGWGQNPTVIYRGESNGQRLKFYSYVDPGSSGFMFLFVTWINESPAKVSSNTLKFHVQTIGTMEPANTGTFSNATEVPCLLALDAIHNTVGLGITAPEAFFHVNGDSKFRGTGWFSSKNNGTSSVALSLGQNKDYDYPAVEIRTSDFDGKNNAQWLGTRYEHTVSFQRNSPVGVKNMLKFGGNDGYHSLSIYSVDGTTEAIQFSADGNSRISGNLGIGTSNTQDQNYRLFVEKGIRTRKIKVDQASWPDYVFESNYRLPSLAEIEAFIKANKHLPGVPSAGEVEKEGLDLGNNQAILLKKIEELTLYVVQQQKEIESLKKLTNGLLNAQKLQQKTSE